MDWLSSFSKPLGVRARSFVRVCCSLFQQQTSKLKLTSEREEIEHAYANLSYVKLLRVT